MLSILLGIVWVHSVIYQRLKKALYVSYSNGFIWGTFGIGPVIKSDTMH